MAIQHQKHDDCNSGYFADLGHARYTQPKVISAYAYEPPPPTQGFANRVLRSLQYCVCTDLLVVGEESLVG
jgi:hypothetical protein